MWVSSDWVCFGHSTYSSTVPWCYLSAVHVCLEQCVYKYTRRFKQSSTQIKYKSNWKIGKWSCVKYPRALYHFTKGVFVWNAVLKKAVSTFSSICSQMDSVKHYTGLRWRSSGWNIFLSYFTKHGAIIEQVNGSIAQKNKSVPLWASRPSDSRNNTRFVRCLYR